MKQFMMAVLAAAVLAACTGGDGSGPVADPLAGLSWLDGRSSYGSVSMLLERAGKAVYVDPVMIDKVQGLPKADLILITHNHTDHYSPKSVKDLLKKGTVIATSADVAFNLGQLKIKGVKSVKPGDEFKAAGFKIKALPMVSTAGSNSHHAEAEWVGFLLDAAGARYYFSGDSSLGPETRSLENIDVAVLNLRADYVVGGAGMADWAAAVKPAALMPVHWGEGLYDDSRQLAELKAAMPQGVKLLLPEKRK
jgi:L-ascorbate metabolism protein UlaG (beta-lactamase superfamily)